MNFNVSKSIKGIVGVSFTNIVSLVISMLISFILPLFLSVEGYGYWQLYVLYSSFVGLFAFGFNDGIHLNYAGRDYDESLWHEESAYIRFLIVLSIVETILVNIVLILMYFEDKTKYCIFVITSFNILPTLLCGMISFINQSSMRYEQYAIGHIVERIVFIVFMGILILLGEKNPIIYIGAYTVSKYFTIVYHFFTSSEAFKAKPASLQSLNESIKRNFTSGMILMISVTLNSSIIVFSRLLVERYFGISEFSAYSFSLHTLVVASQLIAAVTAVFYPILKRCDDIKFREAYKSFDISSSLLSALLLLSYYFVAVLISLIYKKYAPVLSYLYIVYPLFIFQCKSNLLIINTYKVKLQQMRMLIMNGIGILINVTLTVLAFLTLGTVPAIATATLLGFILWYYICQFDIHRQYQWKLPVSAFIDLFISIVFILVNFVVYRTHYGLIEKELFGFLMCLLILVLVFVFLKRDIKRTIKSTLVILDK